MTYQAVLAFFSSPSRVLRMRLLSGLFALLFCGFMAQAQQSLWYEDPYRDFKEGQELFRQGHYAAAAKIFERIEKSAPNTVDDKVYDYQVASSYYRAVCALELYNPNAENQLLDFVNAHEDDPLKVQAYYQLGRYYFRDKKYKTAIDWFSKVQPADLEPDDRTAFSFQLGYSYFNRKMLSRAKPLFDQVRRKNSTYYYPANYYYGYLALQDGEFEDALASFDIAAESKTYAKVVPYSVAQVYFAQGDYDRVIEYVQPYIEDSRLKYYVEMQQLIGQAYYAKGEHAKALPYLQFYVDEARKVRSEDYFQLASAFYAAEQYPDAIKNFSKLDVADDSLGQEALFLSGTAHLKLGDKEAARSAFQSATRKDYNPERTEEATFNYAKLSSELNYDKIAIEEFEAFLEDYPQSEHYVEAQELLVEAFLSTNDYGQAIETLQGISEKTPAMDAAMQKVAFYRGVELYNNREYKESRKFFDLATTYPKDQSLVASSNFWLGELAMRAGDLGQGLSYHQDFRNQAKGMQSIPGGASLTASHYSSGYARLQQEDYSSAKDHFRKVTDNWSLKSADRQLRRSAIDAQMRLADCYFMLKDYKSADYAYSKVTDAKIPGADYALYQRGIILGLQNKNQQKIKALQDLYRDFPESSYANNALFEIGDSHFNSGRYASAIGAFETLLREDENGPFTSRAKLKLGLLHFNRGENQKALKYYTEVAENYPGSSEGFEALSAIRDISVEIGKPEIYSEMANLAPSAKDSVTWDAAFAQYSNGDCVASIQSLDRYLREFPDGYFALPARFYRAECHYEQKNYEQASRDYSFVYSRKNNRFTETALVKAGRIAYNEQSDYSAALEIYEQLYQVSNYDQNTHEALLGMLLSSYKLNEYDKVLSYSEKMLASDLASEGEILEANFYRAKALQAQGKNREAEIYYQTCAESGTNIWAAESMYRLAEIAFMRDELEQAQEKALRTIREQPSSEQWVVNSYILIGDILIEQDNLVQARATLESLLSHYSSDKELSTLIASRIDKIDRLQRRESRIEQPSDQSEYPFDNDPLEEDPPQLRDF